MRKYGEKIFEADAEDRCGKLAIYSFKSKNHHFEQSVLVHYSGSLYDPACKLEAAAPDFLLSQASISLQKDSKGKRWHWCHAPWQ